MITCCVVVAVVVAGIRDTGTNNDFTPNAWGTYFWVGSENDGTNQLYGTIFSIAFFDKVLLANEQKFMHDTDWRTLNL